MTAVEVHIAGQRQRFSLDVFERGWRRPPHLQDRDWMADAACVGARPGLFFSTQATDIEQARDVCSLCSARRACLNYAVLHGQREGVWGGLVWDGERDQLAKVEPRWVGCDLCGTPFWREAGVRETCAACKAMPGLKVRRRRCS